MTPEVITEASRRHPHCQRPEARAPYTIAWPGYRGVVQVHDVLSYESRWHGLDLRKGMTQNRTWTVAKRTSSTRTRDLIGVNPQLARESRRQFSRSAPPSGQRTSVPAHDHDPAANDGGEAPDKVSSAV